jgi:hypothetical protein
MIRIYLLILSVSMTACHDSDKVKKGKESWVEGTVVSNQGIDTIFYHNCYCNKVNSKIIVNHVYYGGMHGGHLTTTKTKDSLDFDLGYYSYHFRAVAFKTKSMTLDNAGALLGDTISGTIALSGHSEWRDEKYDFELKGNFRCVLKDSTYTHERFYDELLRVESKRELQEKLQRAKQNPDSIHELHLNYLYLTEMPTELRKLRNLKVLYLNENEISQIDTTIISHLVSLKELHLYGDKIKELPSALSKLTNLEVLELTANPLSELPGSVFELKNLRTLELGATEIDAMPKSIVDLQSLEKLDIGYTNITNIPQEIFRLRRLTHLDLPDSLGLFKIKNWEIEQLKHLDVPYEFLMHNLHIINNLKNLDWLYVNYQVKANEDTHSALYREERYFERMLPNVSIQVRDR